MPTFRFMVEEDVDELEGEVDDVELSSGRHLSLFFGDQPNNKGN